MPRFIKVQRLEEGMSTSSIIHLNTINPTIVKDVKMIYDKFPSQDRLLVLQEARQAIANKEISDSAYRFILENAGIRKVLFDDETELPIMNSGGPADVGVDLSKVDYFDVESFEKYINKPFSNIRLFVDSVHCSDKGDLFIVNLFCEISMANHTYKLFAKDNTVTTVNIADPRMSISFEAKVEKRKLVFLGVVKKLVKAMSKQIK